MDRLSPEQHLATRWREVAGHDLDQGRLAGAVVAHEADDLAGLQREIDAGERLDRAEMLGNTPELENCHGATRLLPSLRQPVDRVP